MGFLSGASSRAPGQLFLLPHEGRARNVDVDVVLVVGIDDQRVGMRAAAGLDGADLLRILDVGNIEDSHAAKTFRGCGAACAAFSVFFLMAGRRRWRRWREALRAAIQAAVRHLDGHKQQVAIDGDIALPARAYQRSNQRGFRRV